MIEAESACVFIFRCVRFAEASEPTDPSYHCRAFRCRPRVRVVIVRPIEVISLAAERELKHIPGKPNSFLSSSTSGVITPQVFGDDGQLTSAYALPKGPGNEVG